MHGISFISTSILIIFLAGCSGQKEIDASSDKALTKSIEQIKDSLSPEDKEKFEDALTIVALGGIENFFDLANISFTDAAKKALHGKTAQEIISEAETLQKKHRVAQKKQIMEEIAELEAKKEKADLAALELKKFKIVRSRFYFSDSRFLEEPVIELTVQNNTKHAVARAYFHGVLATPGRSVPWVEDDFNYIISGGLEPGESATWELAPNMFGDWGRAPKDRKDMILTVHTVRIDGAGDNPIIYDSEYSDYDKERLAELQEKLKDLN